MKIMDKAPPQDLGSEMAVLGSMLMDEEAINKCLESLSAGSFYSDAHGKIFESIIDLHKDNGKVDLVILTDKMRGKGCLEEVGGAAYLTSLTNAVPTAANVEYYAKIVREKATLRNIIALSHKTSEEAYKGNGNCAEVIANANAEFSKLAREQTDNDFIASEQWGTELSQDFKNRIEKGISYSGLSCEYDDIDKKTGGLERGDLVVIAGPTSIGKTAFELDIFYRVGIKKKMPCAFFSLEMTRQEIGYRLLSKMSGISLWDIKLANLNGDKKDKVYRAIKEMENSPVFIASNSGLNLSKVCGKAKKIVSKEDVVLVIIDYLQLIGNPSRNKARFEEVASVAQGLKRLARELDIPIIAGSQVNSEFDNKSDKRPTLEHLRESRTIAHEADTVMFVHRPKYFNLESNDRSAEIAIRKARHGKTGIAKLTFNEATVSFEELSH